MISPKLPICGRVENNVCICKRRADGEHLEVDEFHPRHFFVAVVVREEHIVGPHVAVRHRDEGVFRRSELLVSLEKERCAGAGREFVEFVNDLSADSAVFAEFHYS